MLALYVISAFLASAVNIGLGVFLYLNKPVTTAKRVLGLLSWATASFCAAMGATALAPSRDFALIAAKFINGSSVFVFPLYTHFIAALLDQSKKRRHVIGVAYGFAFLFFIANLTPYLIKDVEPTMVLPYYPVVGPLYNLLLVYWFTFLTIPFIWLIFAYRKSAGIRRNQLRYIFIASVIGFSGGVSTSIPAFSRFYFPFSFLLVSLYVFILSYSIVKHRLMDVQVVIRKTVTYSLLLLLLLVPCLAVIIMGEYAAHGSSSLPFITLLALLLAAVAFVFPKLKLQAQKNIEQVLFKGKYDYYGTIEKSSRVLASTIQLNELLEYMNETYRQVVGAESSTIYIFDEWKAGYVPMSILGDANDPPPPNVESTDRLVQFLRAQSEVVLKEELMMVPQGQRNTVIIEAMDQLKSEMCVPLNSQTRLVGFIACGPKPGDEAYTSEEMSVLMLLAIQAAMAMENAILFENLKKERAIVRRAERLASLGRLAAGVAHEIRNPMVSISTFLQLLPERVHDEEFRDEFLKVALSETERINKLIQELLTFSRPAEPNFREGDIQEVINAMEMLISNEARKKNIEIQKDFNGDHCLVVFDKEKIKQVFLNILINAIQSMPDGGRIVIQTRQIRFRGKDNYVQIGFSDTGTGISEENLEHIFSPFYTTKDQGSGLGLAIAHQIIQEHHGTILVESKPNEGTTFYINLPENPLDPKTIGSGEEEP